MLKDALKRVQDQLSQAAQRSNRSQEDITLIGVTKTVPLELVKEAIGLGVKAIGESRIQEAQKKLLSKDDLPAEWHFIGHLQSNKAKYAVRLFDMIQSVDSASLAQVIDSQAKALGKIQACLVEVKVSPEPNKFGVPVEQLSDFLRSVSQHGHIRIEGLMTIAPYSNDPEAARPYFRKARACFERMKTLRLPNVTMKHLSMGMSDDFAIAIEEGSTMVRIGTAIFGARAVHG